VDERYTLPELPNDYAALEPHYSARALELHHDKHHAAYVAGANATLGLQTPFNGKETSCSTEPVASSC
jgi:superoxide dismutase